MKSSMQLLLPLVDNWWSKRPTMLSILLLPWTALFTMIVIIRRCLFKLKIKHSTAFPVPVIVVGNLVVGGSGKTPLVVYIAKQLKAAGYKPGIVSRGYGAKDITEPKIVKIDSTPSEVGDEPLLIVRETDCPMVICAKRVAAVECLLKEFGCNVVISDDGLQHYAMCRDIEIVVIDGSRYFGNGWCLPSGPLREPLARLNVVDFLVVNGLISIHFDVPNKEAMKMELKPLDTIVSVAHDDKKIPLKDFRGKIVHGVAGIGNPERFFNTLRKMGLTVIPHPFPDHYNYKGEDINFGDDKPVIMTTKDAVKCRPFADERHYCLPVEAEVEAIFMQKLLEKIEAIKKG